MNPPKLNSNVSSRNHLASARGGCQVCNFVLGVTDNMQSQKNKKVVITSKSALEDLVYTMIILHGSDCSLNHIDVSRITDFSGLCMIVNIIDTGS
ncbi:hypothetical protein [Succinivibrio sp.]|uniref:hypothetical protein n=1 Tax=Succinivibrio sp. TaxID=2053619 RepID=UPI0025E6D6F8|nr:hypothetical protein [Succinivibrio sp.]MBQ9220450.1 hypothetical protein [Succinivibrio sp.]